MDLHHLIDAGENDSLKCPKCALALAGSPEPGRLKPGISCDKCHQVFHYECIKELEDTLVWGLEGDDFFVFACETCAPPEGRALRMNLSWLDVVHITLFTLTHTITSSTPENTSKDTKVESYFSLRGDILPFIVVHWHHFWEKDSSMAWTNSVASCLANHEGSRFIRHNEPGYWGLIDAQLYPSQHGVTESLERMHWAVLYELNNGRLVPPTPRKIKRRKAAAVASGEMLVKHRLKRKKRSPRPIYGKDVATIMIFPDLDNLPGPVRMSNHPTHTATQVSINEHGDRVSNAKGYRTAKASHAAHHGAWYLELKRTNTRGMTRCGFAQISADLQGPCGMDIFGYSFRADPPTTFHKGMGETYGIRGYGDQGDTLGLLLFIPTITPDQERDLQERFWQMEYRYEAFQYKSPSLEQAMSVLKDSEICYFLNGVCLGVAFKDLYLGRYYPAVSCYEDAEVQVNFGPEFVHPPPRSWKDLSVRAFCELEQEILPGEVQRVLAFEGEEEFGLGEDADEEEDEEEEHLSSSSF